MPLSNLEIATRVRNLLSERSTAAVDVSLPHIIGLISTGLELWTREIMSDREKLPMLTSDYSLSMTAGVLDLTNYINGTTAKISLQDLRSRPLYITISGIRTPLTWMNSQAQLNFGRYPASVPAVYLDGNKLRTRNTDGSLTSLGTAAVEFEVVTYPTTATDLPPALLGDFILFLANLASKEKLLG